VGYLNNIDQMSRGSFLYIGNRRASESISDLVSEKYDSFELAETRSSGWQSHKISGAGVGGAAGLAASMMLEQCYVRTVTSQFKPAKLSSIDLEGRGLEV
jgi:mevalonate kinase